MKKKQKKLAKRLEKASAKMLQAELLRRAIARADEAIARADDTLLALVRKQAARKTEWIRLTGRLPEECT